MLRTWLCGLVVAAMAAPLSPGQQYSFSEVTEGLGNLNVNCVAQDRSGYLWVGTENGLYRFDGSQFRQFGALDGLQGRTIQSIYAGQDGGFFVGTTSGLYVQQSDGRFAEVHPPGQVSQFSQRIGTVFSSNAPDRLALADRSGAYLLRRTTTDGWTAEPLHLDGKQIWSVQFERDGSLWYGCDTDLCRLAGGKTTHMAALLHLPLEHWLHMHVSVDGHLWIRGGMHLGEVIPGEDRFEEHDLPGQSNGVPYDALAEDAQGRMIASHGSAFGLWERGRWRMVTAENGLSRYDISALFLDREGSIWVASVGHGLRRWVGQDRWEAFTTAEGLSDNIVWASLRDRLGRLWVGTESGLDWMPADGKTAKAWEGSGIQTARADALAESRDGAIWVGTGSGTLARIDPVSLKGSQWNLPEIYRVLSDGAGRVWVATDGGLYQVNAEDRDRTPHLVEDKAIAQPKRRFSDLCLDGEQRLWAASDGGLYRLDSGGWHHIDTGLSGIVPYQLVADHQGNLWVSGALSGVMRLRVSGDRVTESEHLAKPHLLSEQVISFAVDHRGWVWVGQDVGLSVYDGQKWRSFTQDDGLVWNDLDGYALSEDRDGSMWIGTSAGLSHLMRPGELPSAAPPAPVFSEVTYGGASLPGSTSTSWTTGSLAISVAALSFRDARHLRIRYRLLGLETDWVETPDRSVRYARLEPGSYRFQAMTVDGATGAVSPVAEISFLIAPRWWQWGVLRLGLVLAAALVVVMAGRWRIRVLTEQKRQLELAVQHRTEDLLREKGELLRAREQMRHFAEHDDLTGLWNHRIIMKRLSQEVDRSRRDGTPVSLILIDLDQFKAVNDTFGHPSGDVVLREVGAILQRSVRSYDWVGRYGGEEFLVILPGSSFVSARIRAEQLRMAVQTSRILDEDKLIVVTASLGVASGYPTAAETLLQTADAALYRAKHNGRNCVVAAEITVPEEGAEITRERTELD